MISKKAHNNEMYLMYKQQVKQTNDSVKQMKKTKLQRMAEYINNIKAKERK